MISLIETLNFRCLRFISQPLGQFSVLVGPNASGKTTFLDVVAFLSDLVSEGLDYALGERTKDFRDLVWGRNDGSFELAIEARIPEDRRRLLAVTDYDTVRYEVAVGVSWLTNEIEILNERGWLKIAEKAEGRQKLMFPSPNEPPATIVSQRQKKGRSLFTKVAGGNDNYYADAHPKEGRWAPSFKLGPRKSTLGNLPEDEENFPVSSWFKQFLSKGAERIVLNSLLIRKASPPGQVRGFKPDGSNLPWVVAQLEEKNPSRLREWIAHVRTALPDIEDIRTVVRPDDRHRYLGSRVSWRIRSAVLDGFGWDIAIVGSDFTRVLRGFPRHLPDRRAGKWHSPPSRGDNVSVLVIGVRGSDSYRDPLPGDFKCRQSRRGSLLRKDGPRRNGYSHGQRASEVARLARRGKSWCSFRRRCVGMTGAVPEKDLMVLVADSQMEFAVKGLLTRSDAIGIRSLSVDIHVHPAKDPGCLLRGHEFLRPFHRQYCHALIMLDHEGCGQEQRHRIDLEKELEQRLSSSGWGERAAAVILDPELEVWVWSDSPEVDAVLGWTNRTPCLASWLREKGFLESDAKKPSQPKEALECALRIARKGRSSAIFLQLAQRVSVNRCTDPAFLKLKTTLKQWFGRK